MYQSVSGESKQILWQKYYGVMATESKSPVRTMVEIQNYAAQLRSMGATIDDEMEVARVISSLMNDKFRQFREAWRSVEPPRQTTALLLSRLQTWQVEEESTESTSVATTSAVPQKAYSAKQSKPKKTKEEMLELKKKTKCHLCKAKGHWKSECPEKNKDKKAHKGEESEGAYATGVLSDLWINDSGANRHYCGRLEWFFDYKQYSQPKPVSIADNSQMLVEGVRKVRVKALINRQWKEIEIHLVEYIPGGANLFSENILLDKGFEVRKNREGAIVYYKDGRPDIAAERVDGLQIIKFRPVVSKALACLKQATWHERMGHINGKFLLLTQQKGAVYGLEKMTKDDYKCEVCLRAKSTKKSYKSVEKTGEYKPGECLHSDLVHASTTSRKGNKYFLLVKDEASSFRQVYFQKTKDETAKNIKDAINFISNQTGNSVKNIPL